MKTTITVKALVDSAMERVKTLSISQFKSAQQQTGTVVVDIRDVRELQRMGKIPGAVHMPRGMLEFWFDGKSPYYSEELIGEAERVIFYCAAGWRSALATQTILDMGIKNVAHLDGGFNGWSDAGEAIEVVENPGEKN